MSNWKRLLGRVLNPRSDLGQIPSFADTVGPDFNADEAPGGARSVLRPRDILLNIPLMLGILIVVALFFLVVFGPLFAPQNPYIAGQHIVPHFDREAGVFVQPPLDPSPEFPLGTDQWGTDILSLLMHGARNTIIACAFITMLRVLIGIAVGAYAGWNEGRWMDRLLMGVMGTLTSLPLLISTMILIFVLDIRQGLPIFIIALSVLGWTEIGQYIRSEFLVLRKMPYIESATATGLSGLQIAVRHVLPNVLPQLLVITFLEMGAVLMLLGELAFVGVFIGGGSRVDLTEPFGPREIFTIPEVPEWGAMLANGSRYLRSKPFIVMPPAVAFFIAVLGFTSLGEGFRRLIDKRMVSTAFLLRRRMLLVIAGVSLATAFIMSNTGAAPWFARVAQAFNGDFVYEHVVALSEMEGRAAGQPGGDAAAAYIAAKFEEYGLESGWRRQSYFYPFETRLVNAVTQPALTLQEGDATIATYAHQIDFGFVIDGHGGSGEAHAPVTFVAFTDLDDTFSIADYAGLDLRGRIVLALAENVPAGFTTEALIRGAEGVLLVTGDGRDDVRSQRQLAGDSTEYLRSPNIPILKIRPRIAEAITGVDDTSLSELYADANVDQQGRTWFTHDLSAIVTMSVLLSSPEMVEVPNVLGYIPGSDLDLADEMLVLFASYDGLGIDPDGAVYPAANHNASGVAMLLEIARLWQEQSLDVRRTTMFVAWGGSQLDDDGAQAWLENEFNFRHVRSQAANSNIGPSIIFQFDYLGAGGETLLLHPQSSDQLIELIQETSSETGLPVALGQDASTSSADIIARGMPFWITMKWSDAGTSPENDILASIDPAKLQQFGEMISLALTRLVRESTF